jgi:hypothetical protein
MYLHGPDRLPRDKILSLADPTNANFRLICPFEEFADTIRSDYPLYASTLRSFCRSLAPAMRFVTYFSTFG